MLRSDFSHMSHVPSPQQKSSAFWNVAKSYWRKISSAPRSWDHTYPDLHSQHPSRCNCKIIGNYGIWYQVTSKCECFFLVERPSFWGRLSLWHWREVAEISGANPKRFHTHKAREVAPVRDRLVECEGFWPSQDVTIVIVDLYLQGNIQRQFAWLVFDKMRFLIEKKQEIYGPMTYLQSISESAMFSHWTQLSSWLCSESRSRHGLRVCTALQGHVILLAVRDESLLSSPESSESNNCYFLNLFMHFLWFSFCVSANNLTHHQSVLLSILMKHSGIIAG